MRTGLKRMLGLAAAALLASGVAASGAVVTNGSFDDVNHTFTTIKTGQNAAGRTQASLSGNGVQSWGVFEELPGWKTISGPGIEVQTTGTINGLGPINPHSGGYYIELDSDGGTPANSGMKQSVNLTAGKYNLSFAYSPRINQVLGSPANTNGIQVQISDGSTTVLDEIVQGPPPAINVWEVKNFAFLVKNGGPFDLKFTAVGKSDTTGGFIDTVSIAAIPLPAAAWFLIGGVAALGFAARRTTGQRA